MAEKKITEVTTAETLNSNDSLIISQDNILKQISKDKLLDTEYPVGTAYVTTTNENPSGWLGGTWVLYDKQFQEKYWNASDSSIFTPTANISTFSVYAFTSGHEVHMFVSVTSAVEVADTSLDLGTFNFAAMGFSRLKWAGRWTAQCDGGNSIVMLYLNQTTGLLQSVDVVGDDPTAADKAINVSAVIPVATEYMDDSACDKFFWRRTA